MAKSATVCRTGHIPGCAALRKMLSAMFVAALVLIGVAPANVTMAQQPPSDTGDIAKATSKLFEAVQKNNISGVRTAIAIGASTTATNEWGMTATDLAVEKGYFDIAHFLLSVRNMRNSEPKKTTVSPSDTLPPATPTAVAKTVAPAKETVAPVKDQKTITIKQATAEMEKPLTSWPADKPNPFDPNAVAEGSSLPIIGKVEEAPQRPAIPPGTINGFPSAPTTRSASANTPYADKRLNSTTTASGPVTGPEQPGFFGRIIDSVIPDWIKGETASDTTPVTDQNRIAGQPKAPGPTATSAPKPAKPTTPAKIVVREQVLKPARAAAPKRVIAKAPAPKPTPKPVKAAAPKRVIAKAPAPKQTPKPVKVAAPKRVIAKAPAPKPTPKPVKVAAPRRVIAKAPAPKPTPKPVKAAAPRRVIAKARIQPPETTVSDSLKLAERTIKPGTSRTNASRKNDRNFNELSDQLLLNKGKTRSSATKEPPKVTAKITSPRAKPAKTVRPPAKYLSGIKLTIGEFAGLGQPLIPNKMSLIRRSRALKKPAACINKNHGALAFCIESVNWPEKIKSYFVVDSVIYQGTKTVVRYDNGIATFFHTLFPTTSFKAVTSYYQYVLGPPTSMLKRSIAPLAEPRRDNPTYIWKSENPVTRQITTLEIRKFDDARGGFPDTRNGVIMLYGDSSLPIFPQLSTVETMLINSNTRLK